MTALLRQTRVYRSILCGGITLYGTQKGIQNILLSFLFGTTAWILFCLLILPRASKNQEGSFFYVFASARRDAMDAVVEAEIIKLCASYNFPEISASQVPTVNQAIEMEEKLNVIIDDMSARWTFRGLAAEMARFRQRETIPDYKEELLYYDTTQDPPVLMVHAWGYRMDLKQLMEAVHILEGPDDLLTSSVIDACLMVSLPELHLFRRSRVPSDNTALYALPRYHAVIETNVKIMRRDVFEKLARPLYLRWQTQNSPSLLIKTVANAAVEAATGAVIIRDVKGLLAKMNVQRQTLRSGVRVFWQSLRRKISIALDY